MKLTRSTQLTLIALVAIAAVMPADLQIMLYANAHNACRPFFAAITDIGLGKWYVGPAGLIAIIGFVLWKIKKLPEQLLPWWRAATQIFLSVAGAGIFTDILKCGVARARPVEFLQYGIYGFFNWPETFGPNANNFHSFPSGHATTMFSFATAVALMLPEKFRWARIAVFVFAGIICISRIMVEAHYPSDVMAGTIIGAWGAVLAKRTLQKWQPAIS